MVYGTTREDGLESPPVDGVEHEFNGVRFEGKRFAFAGVVLLAFTLVLHVSNDNFSDTSTSVTSLSTVINGVDLGEFPLDEVPKNLEDTYRGSRPNIILFTMDDVGWNDVGYSDHSDFPGSTPFINKLASEGVKFTHFYAQPSCTPSRVTILTGQFAHKSGFNNVEVHHNSPIGIPLSFKLLPQYMREQDYKTVGFGKWNVGHCNMAYLPHMRGFESFTGYSCPGHGYRDFICGFDAGVRDLFVASCSKESDGDETCSFETGVDYLGTYDTEIYHDGAVSFIREYGSSNEDKPFFMWLAHHGAHGFLDSEPEPPKSLLTEEHQSYIRVLKNKIHDKDFFKKRLLTATIMSSLDYSLEKIYLALHDHDLLHKSFIVVHSDNGGDPDYSYGHPGNNYPLRGTKFQYNEGGIRIPAFIYSANEAIIPQELRGTTYHGLVHHVDLLPTFVTLAGGAESLTSSDELDGRDFMRGIIKGQATRNEVVLSLPRTGADWTFGKSNFENAAIIIGKYKMVITGMKDKCYSTEANETGFISTMCSYDWYGVRDVNPACFWGPYLFDLETDPTEETNVWMNPATRDAKVTMIERIHELLESSAHEYHKILYEYYEMGTASNATYLAAMEKSDYWTSPWDCDLIQ